MTDRFGFRHEVQFVLGSGGGLLYRRLNSNMQTVAAWTISVHDNRGIAVVNFTDVQLSCRDDGALALLLGALVYEGENGSGGGSYDSATMNLESNDYGVSWVVKAENLVMS